MKFIVLRKNLRVIAMGIWQGRSRRKPTGGRYCSLRKKRKTEIGREILHTFVRDERKKSIRTTGGGEKLRLLGAHWANVVDQKENRSEKLRIIGVIENTANPHYVRRNIITKGAVIELEGEKLAKVTSRPGQHGIINAIYTGQRDKTMKRGKKK